MLCLSCWSGRGRGRGRQRLASGIHDRAVGIQVAGMVGIVGMMMIASDPVLPQGPLDPTGPGKPLTLPPGPRGEPAASGCLAACPAGGRPVQGLPQPMDGAAQCTDHARQGMLLRRPGAV